MEFHDIIKNIVTEFSFKYKYYEILSSGLMKTLLIEMLRANTGISHYEDTVASQIIRYIKQNIDKSITNESIGKVFGYHPNSLNRIIINSTGVTLHKYIINIRLEKAAQLLRYTDMSINEIAKNTGFENTSYFSYSFRQKYKFSASEYRKRQLN